MAIEDEWTPKASKNSVEVLTARIEELEKQLQKAISRIHKLETMTRSTRSKMSPYQPRTLNK